MTGTGVAASPVRPSASAFSARFPATSGELEDLQTFYILLAEWGQRMNLVGPSALSDFWSRHVLDSAQLLHVEQSALRWADIGSGAGFPGIVLAILLKQRRGARVHLVESIAKRVSFLRHVAAALSLPADVHHVRAENLASPPGLEIITARACAPFPRLFQHTAHFFQAGAIGLFLKGRTVEAELTEARKGWTFTSELLTSHSHPEGQIVRIKGLKSRG